MKRAVVTGIGCITPIGRSPSQLWKSLLAGRNGAGPVQAFDTRRMDRHIGCEIRGWRRRPQTHGTRTNGSQGRATDLAIYAATQAVRDSGLSDELESAATCVGTTMSEAFNGVCSIGPRVATSRACPDQIPLSHLLMNHMAHEIARVLGSNGPAVVIPTACAAGNYAIGQARDLIMRGITDIAIAGGADAFSRIAFIGFARVLAMSPDTCRPFDRNRQGLLVGEGSGFLVLEELGHARKRKAHIYAEILSCGLSCDGFHIAAPHPDGIGAALAMQRAMKEAQVSTDSVDYISAHGTGTQANDRIETLGVKRVFGRRAHQIPISSIKALLGHAMGAASAIEAVMCCLALKERTIPPTWNYREPDPACGLDYVPNQPRTLRRLNIILSNSFAFGGNNACLALGRYR